MGPDKLIKELLSKLSYVEQRAQETLATEHHHEINFALFNGFRSAGLSFLKSLFGETHPYYTEFNKKTCSSGYYQLLSAIEILKSLRTEIENNWLISFKDIVSADIFSDFLEMAKYLLENKYKDAAAVIIGSVLENHLKHLCSKNNIETTYEKDGRFISIKADRLNADLASAKIYNKVVQTNITAWLALRNNAAHGKYDEYTIEQVKMMHTGVSDFIMRY